MMIRFLATTVALALPLAVVGQNTVSHSCRLGDLTRRVEIVSEPGRAVPCEVHYYKDSEAPGEREVLWSATNRQGYCEQKTEEFVARLESWGWDCSASGVATPGREATPGGPAESEPDGTAPEADDTGDLAPAPEPATEQD
jgi:hypothetical protein